MKTRRKSIKTPAKGRRSSIICVKKSPIRRYPRRSIKKTINAKIAEYDSPLKHLRHNGSPVLASTSADSVLSEELEELNMEDEDKEKLNKSVILTTTTMGLIKTVMKKKVNLKKGKKGINNSNANSVQSSTLPKRKRILPLNERKVDNTPKSKIPKLKKSPLSRINETSKSDLKNNVLSKNNETNESDLKKNTSLKSNENNNSNLKKSTLSKIGKINESDQFSDSIIIVDDSDFKPVKQSEVNKSIQNSISSETKNVVFSELKENSSCAKQEINSTLNRTIENPEKIKISESLTNSEDIVIVDSNDSMMEMEAYHEAFNQSTNVPSTASNFVDSVIVIDPDDESPVPTRCTTPKPTEDCFVVWSSLPKPCTSNSESNAVQFSTPHQSSAPHQSSVPHQSFAPHKTPLVNNNSEILKLNKILLDTKADYRYRNYLNNENNSPLLKNFVKSPKANSKGKFATNKCATKVGTYNIPSNAEKTTLKTATKTTLKTAAKVAARTTTTKTVKEAIKVAPKTATKTAVKSTTKSVTKTSTTATASKKKAKTNGELIFLSQSKEEESTTKKKKPRKGSLREIVVDGSNVAMAYTNNRMFSEKGIKMLIEYFTKKGHNVKVFVPQYRRSRNFPLLEKWHSEGIVVFTPSRKLGNKSITPYDDRYILEYATACDGIVVSQDQFRDLYAEKPQYRETIENRLLVPTFVGDYVMFPEDPLGRDGPTLTEFLRH